LAEELLQMAQSLGDPALRVVGHYVMGVVFYRLGELVSSLQHLDLGLSLYDPQQHHSQASHYIVDPGVACLCFAAHTLWLLGYPDQAAQRNQQALTLAQQLSHPLSLAIALYFLTVLCHFRREPLRAQELAETAMTHASKHGFAHWLTQATMLRGWARAMQGDGETGIAQIHPGVRAFQTDRDYWPRPYPLSLLVEALYTGGQITAGLQVLEQVLTLVEQGAIRWWQPELYRLKGELLLHQQVADPAEAERALCQALELARQRQEKSLELRVVMSLSRLWQQQGKGGAARQVLAEMYGWFTEGFDTADLQEAKALLTALS
jgi:predicted ATPase